MVRITPQEAAAKMVRRTTAATADVARGVDNVTEAPGMKAAASADRMLASISEAITSGRWADAVSKITLQEWKTAMKTKGIPRIAQGVQAAEPKIAAYFARAFPIMEQIQTDIDNMPNVTLEDRIARSAEWQRRMNSAKESGQLG